MSKNKFKIILIILGFLIVILIFVFIFLILRQKTNGNAANKLDAFAQCLASKNITMYGAAWCSHCQNEKAAFGSSFKFVPYVECPGDSQKCLEKGITGYPTWIFPDGSPARADRKFIGEQGLEKLSQESGCPLPSK